MSRYDFFYRHFSRLGWGPALSAAAALGLEREIDALPPGEAYDAAEAAGRWRIMTRGDACRLIRGEVRDPPPYLDEMDARELAGLMCVDVVPGADELDRHHLLVDAG